MNTNSYTDNEHERVTPYNDEKIKEFIKEVGEIKDFVNVLEQKYEWIDFSSYSKCNVFTFSFPTKQSLYLIQTQIFTESRTTRNISADKYVDRLIECLEVYIDTNIKKKSDELKISSVLVPTVTNTKIKQYCVHHLLSNSTLTKEACDDLIDIMLAGRTPKRTKKKMILWKQFSFLVLMQKLLFLKLLEIVSVPTKLPLNQPPGKLRLNSYSQS